MQWCTSVRPQDRSTYWYKKTEKTIYDKITANVRHPSPFVQRIAWSWSGDELVLLHYHFEKASVSCEMSIINY